MFSAKYKGAPQLVQFSAVTEQVAQLGLQALQILLSVTSPYSLLLVQVDSHFLVELLPHKGEGQAATHEFELR